MTSLKNVVELLDSNILSLPSVRKTKSKWGHGLAYTVGKREFLHFHGEDELDIRLTRRVLRDRRDKLQQDRRARFRVHTSDWIAFRCRTTDDARDAFELVKLAWQANR